MTARPTVALPIWGDRFEDVFTPLGISLDDFRDLTGSWFLGYVEGLRRAEVDTVLVLVSAQVRWTTCFEHRPTGARVVVLRTPRRYRVLKPLRRHLEGRRWGHKAFGSLTSYLSVPLTAFLRVLRQEAIDVVLVQDYEHARFDLFVLLGRLARRPVFSSFQGGDTLRSRLERPLRRRSIRACAGFVVGSAAERDRVRRVHGIPDAKVAAIPNAIDVHPLRTEARAEARRELGVPAATTVVEWHGRVLLHRKGLDTLVAAWQQVCAERPDRDLLLLLLGTGPDAPALHRMIDASGVASVRWRDEFVTQREELAPYLAAADIYVLPSRHEGFPIALLEAMANELAVVATDVPGVADILGGAGEGDETGLLVPRDDPAALATGLGRLLDDDRLVRQLGAAGRERVVLRYSVDAVGRDLAAFLLGGARS
jgi:glycosyltransferase involved in cell wall biosynthesis